MKWLAILVLGSAFIALPVFAHSQHGQKGNQGMMMGMSGSETCSMRDQGNMMGMMHHGMMNDPVYGDLQLFGNPEFYTNYSEELGLSENQGKKLEQNWYEYKKDAIQKKTDIEVAQLELKNILNQEPIDFKKAKVKISEISSLQESLRLACLLSIEKARNVLTADQINKLSTLKRSGTWRNGMMQGQMKGMMMGGMGKDERIETEK